MDPNQIGSANLLRGYFVNLNSQSLSLYYPFSRGMVRVSGLKNNLYSFESYL